MSTARVALVVDASVKCLRETLCVAQSAIVALYSERGLDFPADQQHHVQHLQRLIDACDVHRPLGPDGKHGDGPRCTATCGCERPDPPTTCTHPADAACPRCRDWPKCAECKWYHDPDGPCIYGPSNLTIPSWP